MYVHLILIKFILLKFVNIFARKVCFKRKEIVFEKEKKNHQNGHHKEIQNLIWLMFKESGMA